MTHEEFMNLYDDSLRHGWVTSKIASIAAKQKERERQYNHEYYQKHSERWKKNSLSRRLAEGDEDGVTVYSNEWVSRTEAPKSGVTYKVGKYVPKTKNGNPEAEKRLKDAESKLRDAQKELKRNPSSEHLRARVQYYEDEVKGAKIMSELTKKSASELSSQAQVESAARRRAIVQGMKLHDRDRSKMEKILDKADITIESARRKANITIKSARRIIDKGAEKVNKLFKDHGPEIAAMGAAIVLSILTGKRITLIPIRRHKREEEREERKALIVKPIK